MEMLHPARLSRTPSSASIAGAMSRSSSISGEEPRRLSFRGQLVKVVMPPEVPESTKSGEGLAEKILDIQFHAEEEVNHLT
jgi:hypothetical protein